MVQNRDGIFDQNLNDVTPILNLINHSLNEIYKVFSNVFAEGKQKPTGLDALKLGLFEEIWQYLHTRPPEFESLNELNQYYNQLTQHLEEYYIADYCKKSGLPK